MKIYTTFCDMGSVKIFTKDMSCFFNNGFGDGEMDVKIYDKKIDTKDWEFLGHFTVKTVAYLSQYDCEDTPIYKFEKGRYFVYLVKPLVVAMVLEDKDIHA